MSCIPVHIFSWCTFNSSVLLWRIYSGAPNDSTVCRSDPGMPFFTLRKWVKRWSDFNGFFTCGLQVTDLKKLRFFPLRRTVRPDGHWNQERVFCCFCGWITKRLFYDWFLRYGVLSSRPLRFIIAILLRLGSGRMPVGSQCTTRAPCQVDSQYLDPCLNFFYFKREAV